MCKYGLLYLVAFAIPVLRVQLRFVNCINKRKKKKPSWLNSVVELALVLALAGMAVQAPVS